MAGLTRIYATWRSVRPEWDVSPYVGGWTALEQQPHAGVALRRDGLLVTGDIADHGAEAEYGQAARILDAETLAWTRATLDGLGPDTPALIAFHQPPAVLHHPLPDSGRPDRPAGLYAHATLTLVPQLLTPGRPIAGQILTPASAHALLMAAWPHRGAHLLNTARFRRLAGRATAVVLIASARAATT